MQLLVKRINREPLEQALEEQSVWSLLENGGTFLEGVSLMARWGQVSQRLRGSAEARRLISGVTYTLMDVLDSRMAVGPGNERPERRGTPKATGGL